jgi:CRISPR system Cascade subunit CasD
MLSGIDIDELASALRRPARPLFLGRKTCLPSWPILFAKHSSEAPESVSSLTDVLETTPRLGPRSDEGPLSAWLPMT